jgi:hypothetical protein
MDAMSVRDQMIDFELRKQAMAEASRNSYGEPGVRETVRGFGRLLVRVGEALVIEGHKLENYKVPQNGVSAAQKQAGARAS